MDTIEKQGVLEVRGHVFKRVKSGLDESQVVSVVQSLVDEREELAKRQGHFTSLMKLAEKMIADADVLAEQITSDAQTKADAEARALAEKVEGEARQKADAVVAEALEKANREADSIRQSALREKHESLREQARLLQAELSDSAQGLCQRMLSQAETFTRDLAALQEEFGVRISALDRGIDAEIPTPSTPAPTAPAAETVAAQSSVAVPAPSVDAAPTPASGVAGAPKPSSPDGRYLEIEVLPPRDTVKIRQIETFLKNMAEVETHELENFVDRTSIRVLLRTDVDLCRRLSGHAAVKDCTEVTEKGQRIIRVSLNVKSALDESKDSLSRDIGRILTRK